MHYFCLQEVFSVCKCSGSCWSWRCAWVKLKIGRAHLWASCLYTAFGTSSASPLTPLSVHLLSFSSQSSCWSLSLSLYFPTLPNVPGSGLERPVSPVLAWKTWNRTPLLLPVPDGKLAHSGSVQIHLKSLFHESWIQLIEAHNFFYIYPKYRKSGGPKQQQKLDIDISKCVLDKDPRQMANILYCLAGHQAGTCSSWSCSLPA